MRKAVHFAQRAASPACVAGTPDNWPFAALMSDQSMAVGGITEDADQKQPSRLYVGLGSVLFAFNCLDVRVLSLLEGQGNLISA